MLSKITRYNYFLGSYNIKKYIEEGNEYDIIQDNMENSLIIKRGEEIKIWNYKKRKYLENIRIQIKIFNKIVMKQIDSFDQNNIKQAKQIRYTVLKYLQEKRINNYKGNDIIGIGGEYYIYFLFLNYKKYYGFSNHKTIIEDAKYNFPISKNELVNYNDIMSFVELEKKETYDVIINVINIHENIIKYVCNYDIKNIIIITCKPLETKIKMLEKYVKLVKIDHIINIDTFITICLFKKN